VTLQIELPTREATRAAARALAPLLGPGDVVGLSGPLGAGKTELARAIILARLEAIGRVEEVPSPTYTIVQVYALDGIELWHADLYRLGDPSELSELGLEDAFAEAICLVEWPERLGAARPDRMLDLALAFAAGGEEARSLHAGAAGRGWQAALSALSGAAHGPIPARHSSAPPDPPGSP
jgi:tRNA threonylcarbamoyl adenosine modification protein YjeE